MKRKQGIESSRKLGVGRLVAALIGALCALCVSATPALAAESSITNARTGKTYDKLADATADAQSGDTIKLGEGNYTLYGVSSEGSTKDKDLTFEGSGADKTAWNIGAKVPNPDNFGTEYNGDYSFDGARTVTFKNMTMRSGSADYLGFIRANKTVLNDCVVNGKTFYWGYESAEFNNTTFNAPSGDYAIWTYSSPTMTFNDCTFNASGKVINVYTDYSAGSHDIYVNVNNCTFNSAKAPFDFMKKYYKQALKINDFNMGNYKYVLNITDSSATAQRDDITCSQLFGFGGESANNTGRTDVTIDGVKVWSGGKMLTHDYTDGEYEDNYVDQNNYVWEQREDGWYCIGHAKCGYCGWPIEETVKADATTEASCTEKGKVIYTATFQHECFADQTRSDDLDPLGHDWGEPEYVWAKQGDDWYCTAKRVCKRDASHVEEETVKASYEVTTPATVLKEGVGTYTATFENTAFETQTKNEPIAKLQILPGKPGGGNNTALPGKTSGGNNTALPQTGDPTGMAASVVIAIAGAAAVVGSVIARRRSKM
ncbi:hypothetical protein Pcatena_15370 [Parolsenella catena]|uniref:Gram-positive cocci surface proteins LPxTG domain-containing protein n=1 Tax=Parolsenella catena TaxID=2003188 RepID=A0A3G9KAH4_9ACTN|nr:LPXTG cell wall anchor domain-containing protein [Parolsenella catena]BBH50950.1 hypothetical protein Pcatena_15370 [Parolsenella catena]